MGRAKCENCGNKVMPVVKDDRGHICPVCNGKMEYQEDKDDV